jgi:hypothetical protein
MTLLASPTDLALSSSNGAPVAIARNKPNPAVGQRGIIPQSFDELYRMSLAFSKSGLAPKGIQTPEAIFTAIQFGLEIGLPPMAALQSLAIVNGRPSIYGDAALALVRGSGICAYYLELSSDNAVHALAEELAIALEADDKADVIRVRKLIAQASARLNRDAPEFGYSSISRRHDSVTSLVRRFTISDARRAGLLGKEGPWKQYPERMLMWRCRGFNLRDNFGDVLKGMYTAEEARDIASPQESVLAKITGKPLSEGQVLEVSPAAEADLEAQHAAEGPEITLEQQDAPEPEVAGIEAEPPPVEAISPAADEAKQLADLLAQDWPSVRRVLLDAATRGGTMTKGDAGKAIDAHVVLKLGKKGKEEKITAAERAELYWACHDGRISPQGAIAPKG